MVNHVFYSNDRNAALQSSAEHTEGNMVSFKSLQKPNGVFLFVPLIFYLSNQMLHGPFTRKRVKYHRRRRASEQNIHLKEVAGIYRSRPVHTELQRQWWNVKRQEEIPLTVMLPVLLATPNWFLATQVYRPASDLVVFQIRRLPLSRIKTLEEKKWVLAWGWKLNTWI